MLKKQLEKLKKEFRDQAIPIENADVSNRKTVMGALFDPEI